MNKKFSTLLVSALLAGAVGVYAQTTVPTTLSATSNVDCGKIYYLGNGAISTLVGSSSFILGQQDGGTTTSVAPSLVDEAYAQWILVDAGLDGGAQFYKLQNVATGKYYINTATRQPVLFNAANLTTNGTRTVTLFQIDERSLTAADLNDMDQKNKSFTLQFLNGGDHKTAYSFIDNVFVGKSIIARDAADVFFEYSEASYTGGTFTAASIAPKNGILLQVGGSWNGKPIYSRAVKYQNIAGTIYSIDYPVIDQDALKNFRASSFIILGQDVYSQFATNVMGEDIQGYKYTVVTGAQLLGRVNNYTANVTLGVTYDYSEVESLYRIKNTGLGWLGTTPTIPVGTVLTATPKTYTNNTTLSTSVEYPVENAVFNFVKKGTTAKACVNDVVIRMPNAYRHYKNSNGQSVYQEYYYTTDNVSLSQSTEASVFDFQGQKYVCADNVASAQTHPAFVTNAFIGGMLVDPQSFVAKKVVNVTYYLKQNEFGQWINLDRWGTDYLDENWTWSAEPGAPDVLKKYVDFTVPEGQWLINYNPNNNTYAFVNKESQEVMPAGITLAAINAGLTWEGFKLYDNGNDQYAAVAPTALGWNDMFLVIKAAKEGDNMHGYTNFSDKELENGFNISVVTELMGNIYLKEAHETGHKATFDQDKSNASVWRLKKFTAAKDYVKGIEVSDTIRVISPYSVWNAGRQIFEVKRDTVEALTYSIMNDLTREYLYFNNNNNAYYCDPSEYSDAQTRTNWVDKFVLKEKTVNGLTGVNLIPAVIGDDLSVNPGSDWSAIKLIGSFSENKLAQDIDKYRKTDNDLFAIEPVAAPIYMTLANAFDTVKIFKDSNNNEVFYEKGNFLGMEHVADVPNMKAALFVDTAYVRNETARPQYLLAVGARQVIDETICEIPGHPVHHADTVFGRFLVNMVDSMLSTGTSTHANQYMWDSYPKLAFKEGYHTHDKLAIWLNEEQTRWAQYDLSTNAITPVTYAFRYVDREAGSFLMEVGTRRTNWAQTTGYLKWLNGTPVVVDDIAMAEVLNMTKTDEAPTANEAVAASEVSVVAVNGAIIVKGAAGKVVTVANILGQTIANQVAASDNVTIAAPAGIAVVTVDGEATKVVVK